MALNAILVFFLLLVFCYKYRGSIIVKIDNLLNYKTTYILMVLDKSKYDITINYGWGTSWIHLNLDPDPQHNPPHFLRNTHPEFYSSSECYPMLYFVDKKDILFEQKLWFKGGVDGRYDNIIKLFAYLFHWWCNNPVYHFSLGLLSHACRLGFQLVVKDQDFFLKIESALRLVLMEGITTVVVFPLTVGSCSMTKL